MFMWYYTLQIVGGGSESEVWSSKGWRGGTRIQAEVNAVVLHILTCKEIIITINHVGTKMIIVDNHDLW